MIPDSLLEDRQRALADLVLLECTELRLVKLGFWNVHVLTEACRQNKWSEAGITRDREERRTNLMVEERGDGELQTWPTRACLRLGRRRRVLAAQKVWRALFDRIPQQSFLFSLVSLQFSSSTSKNGPVKAKGKGWRRQGVHDSLDRYQEAAVFPRRLPEVVHFEGCVRPRLAPLSFILTEISSGIFPREPRSRKKANKGSSAPTNFYYAKDIAYLAHEPVLRRLREHKAFAKKLARALGRGEWSSAKSLEENKPVYRLDHIIKERCVPSTRPSLQALNSNTHLGIRHLLTQCVISTTLSA